MNPRKRQAVEPLLPLRSAKQPRMAMSSRQEKESLGARWISFTKDFFDITCETFVAMSTAIKAPSLAVFTFPQLITSSTPPPSPLTSSVHTLSSSTEHAIASHPHRESHSPPSSPCRPPSPPKSTLFSPLSSNIPTSVTPRPFNNLTDVTYPPKLRAAIAESNSHHRKKYPPNKTKRKYRNREHIYAKTHKANVKRTRDAMREELYNHTRRTGYTSDFSTFKDYLGYREKLERIQHIEQQNVLSPSPSLIDLRSQPLEPTRSRRHSFSDNGNDFLQRALDKARATVNAPKPPHPFIPTFEQLQLSNRIKDENIENRLRGPKPQPLPKALSPEANAKVDSLLREKGVVSKFAREQVTDVDLSRLKPSQWLNDEIVNFYGAMILARSEGYKENSGKGGVRKYLDVHYFSTFFWTKLRSDGYDKGRLAKWTKKFDIFSKDALLIPINHSNAHWTGAAINFRQKRIESYDSMGMRREEVFKHLRLYLNAEHLNKKKKPFNFEGWENYSSEFTPQQENGFDCGVFTCQFLESLSRGEEIFNFSQRDMPYLRRRMIWEIGSAILLDR